MANGVVVLAAFTPPDSAKPLAIFIEGSAQDHNAALTAANEFKAAHFPTASVQDCSVDKYNTSVVINP